MNEQTKDERPSPKPVKENVTEIKTDKKRINHILFPSKRPPINAGKLQWASPIYIYLQIRTLAVNPKL